MFRAVIREDLIAENSPLNHIAIRKTFSGVLRFAYYDSCLPKRCRTNETWFGLSSVITPAVFNPFKPNFGSFVQIGTQYSHLVVDQNNRTETL